MTSTELRQILSEELLDSVDGLSNAKPQLEYFLTSLDKEINEVLGTTDLEDLKWINDRLVGRTARTSLGPIHKHRTKVIIIVRTIFRLVVRNVQGNG
jgi:hypothetical protein